MTVPHPVPCPSVAPAERPAILIIDDEPAVRNVTRSLLERAGYRVLTAATGPEGLDVYSAHASDIGLIVLDLTMPRMSGKEVLAELAQRGSVRVVLASGYTHPGALPAGPNIVGFLHKPFRFAELMRVIEQAAR